MAYKKDDIPKVTIDRMKIGGKALSEEVANNILNGNFELEIEKIAKDIAKRQDNAMAMEFTKCIGELLRKNGVVPKMTEYTRNFETDNIFETRYGVSIDELDFSEHDKVFEDKIEDLESLMKKQDEFLEMKNIQIAELKQRIAELESKETVDLPFDPLETANCLINATWERETSSLERGILKCPEYVSNDKYGIDELEQIAEHLLVYCKHNKDFKNDGK